MIKKQLLMVMLILAPCQKYGADVKAEVRTITDGAGRRVTLPAKIERLISIDRGFIPQALRVLGKEKLLAATGGVYPRSGPFNRMKSDTFFLVPHVLDIPDVGWAGYGSYDFEKILEIKPDLVIIMAYGSFKENNYHQELVTRLEKEFRIPVAILQDYSQVQGQESIEAYYRNIRILGEISGAQAASKDLIQKLSNQFALAQSFRKKSNERVLFIGVSDAASGGGFVYGSDFGSAALTSSLLGIQNVRTNFDSPILGPESVLEYNPDVIALVDGPAAGRSLQLYQTNMIFSNLKAVKNNRVYFMGQLQWWADSKLLFPLKLLLDSAVYYQPKNVSRRELYHQYMKNIFGIDASESDTLITIHHLDSLMNSQAK